MLAVIVIFALILTSLPIAKEKNILVKELEKRVETKNR